MSNSPGIGNTSTRPSRAQRREEAARVVPESAPQQAGQSPAEPPKTPPAALAHPTPGIALEPKRGPAKEPLNTRILVPTSKRLNWFTSQHGYAVTQVVDVALQEFLDRNDVPEIDANGEIAQ
ncbi:hypothetical protein [Rhodococcus sp. BH5]|uniref:hypothetical protein n=1 Tax=Rhodococcus sp. BH5 TaxID=2871702 RepID=UPI0022CD9A1B|nr:hypothetical protein [Rhodococcus sp. BH5]MCZ9634956.1 hypothetical protein [Rhodococcus sp. BH5]